MTEYVEVKILLTQAQQTKLRMAIENMIMKLYYRLKKRVLTIQVEVL